MTIQQIFELALQRHQAGRAHEAEQLYKSILERDPKYAGALQYLGVLAAQAGQNDKAIDLMQQAIALTPNWPETYSNLGIVLRQVGRLDEAIAAYRRALDLKSGYAEAHFNLGNALSQKGHLGEAIGSYRNALAPAANYPEAHSNLGNAFKDRGQMDEAIASYRKAIAVKPDYLEAHSNLVLALHYHPAFDPWAILQEHRRWHRQHAERFTHNISPHTNDSNPDRRLRIGYFSPDFRDHVVGRFLLPLLTNRDRQRFDVFAYAQVPFPDQTTQRLRGLVDEWRDVVGISDADAADLIRRDGIDILVDLAGHTAAGRLPIFARKPAPVQVSYMGYANTTGVSTIDYRLTDIYLDPPGIDDSIYSEKSIRLPETYWCYEPGNHAPPVSPLPSIKNGFVTFACLNNPCKVSNASLLTWKKILKAVPKSRLVLYALEGKLPEHVREAMQDEGVDSDRIIPVGRRKGADYLSDYHEVDIALDPFPYTGYTTTFDALWMGVPIVSLAGNSAVSRGGVSILCNLGLANLVANNLESYVKIAIDLAADTPGLQNLRATLRQRLQQSPMMDAPRLTRHIEAAYRQMWRIWCEGRPATVPSQSSIAQPAAQLTVQQSFDLALEQHRRGRVAEADRLYRQILAVHPRHPGALHYLGVVAYQSGQHQIAVDLIRQALAILPKHYEAYDNLGNALKSLGLLDDAIVAYRQAIALNPNSPDAYSNLGVALREKNLLDEVVTAYRKVIAISPNYPEAFSNLGNALWSNGKLDEALDACSRAIALEPKSANAYGNLGNVLKDLRQLDEAIAAYRQAVALMPDLADAHLNLSLSLLARGDYLQGWKEYEWRWKAKDLISTARTFAQPQWDGAPMNGRTILIHAEQGLGDTIQFIRYLRLVGERGGRIVVECQPELQRLLEPIARALPGGCQIIARGQPLPPFDLQCHLLSLPKALKTTLASIPADVPYLFPDPTLVERYREDVARSGSDLNVGLAWEGNPSHRDDKLRSISLDRLAPLRQVHGVTFYSLQKGRSAAQTKPAPPGLNLIDWTNDHTDLNDAAGQMANLDLIITVDTAIAHLAGALGRPTWIMLKFVPDWRWMVTRADSPWYPTVRLFRQPSREDWDSVIKNVADALSVLTD